MLGKTQAKAAKRGAALVNKAELENKQRAIDTQAAGLDEYDTSLVDALDSLDAGEARATGELSPWANAGRQSLSQISALMGLDGPEAQAAARAQFQTDPGYQFRVDQGVQALDRSATARGGLYSGAAMKALNDYGQNMGSAEYGNYFDRLSGIADNGQSAATNIANTAAGFAQNRANAQLGTGQNRAAFRLSTLPHITGANTNAATATATGLKQAADARAQGAGNLVNIGTTLASAAMGMPPLSSFAGSGAPRMGGNGYNFSKLSGLY